MSNRKAARLLCWLMPFLSFLLAETVTGNLFRITPVCVLLNLAVYYLLYFGLFAICKTTKFSWLLLSMVVYGIAAGEYFVISFRERPAMIWDVLALRTALTVSSNYRFTLTPRLALTFLAFLGLGIFSTCFPLERSESRASLFGLWIGGTTAFLALLFGVLVPGFHLSVHMWDPIVSFERQGFLLSTVISFETLFPKRPAGYSREKAESLLLEYTEDGTKAGLLDEKGTLPTNVICIMNESFSDLRIYNGLVSGRSFETDAPYLEYFDRLSENTQKGWLYVPVFGAMTANSEYEFLTGNSCAFAPQGSVPFQFYTREGDPSLARSFREAGYRTVAMHPYPGYNWNRTGAYKDLGFDEFLDLEYYEKQCADGQSPRGYLGDRSNYDGILRLLDQKKPEEKLFVFNVTMQNHGGYEVEGFPPQVHVTQMNGKSCQGQYPKTDQYLTLMKMSDEALSYFLEELGQREEPTLVLLFGDHQPSVETGFFEELYGMRWSQVPGTLKIHSFITPYLVWSNYDRTAADAGDMSAFMLGRLILKEAGIGEDAFFAAIGQVQEEYTAVHAMGRVNRAGYFQDILKQEEERSEALLDYQILQYERMSEERPK